MTKMNNDIHFCETCKYRIKTEDGDVRCGNTNVSLRFYDRACDGYSKVKKGECFIWSISRNVFVIR